MKHIDIQYHFVCEAVNDGKILVVYIPTNDNPHQDAKVLPWY